MVSLFSVYILIDVLRQRIKVDEGVVDGAKSILCIQITNPVKIIKSKPYLFGGYRL